MKLNADCTVVFATNTVTVTDLRTTTVTQTASTTITPTSTVTTATNFVPVASAADYVAKKKKRSISRIEKGLEARQANRGPQKLVITGTTYAYTPNVYPIAVNCVKNSDAVSTRIIGVNCGTQNPTSTTTLRGPTFTQLATVSPTVTSTVTATGATVTVTAVTTVTTASTMTISQVTTATVTGMLLLLSSLLSSHLDG